MTIFEKLCEIDANWPDMNIDSVEKLMVVCYYIGRESAAKELCNRYREIRRSQLSNACKSRYFRKALDILGSYDTLYSNDFEGIIGGTFGYDESKLYNV